jgi:hypothetical protein
MSHLTKAMSKMKNKQYLTNALRTLNVEFQEASEGKKLVGESNYSNREDVKVDILLTQFVGSHNKPAIGFVKGQDGNFVCQGDVWSLKDKDPSRTPQFKVLDRNTSNMNMEKFNNQVSRFYNLHLVKDAVAHKGLSLVEDSVHEENEVRDTVLKFKFNTFVNGEEVVLNCTSKSNGEVEYEVSGVKGTGCKDITDFLDSQLSVLSTVETEEMNMELDVENTHSDFH